MRNARSFYYYFWQIQKSYSGRTLSLPLYRHFRNLSPTTFAIYDIMSKPDRMKTRDAVFTVLAMCVVLFVFQERKALSGMTLGQAQLNSNDQDDFAKAASMVYMKILDQETSLTGTSSRNDFVLKDWKKQTNGGLTDEDRVLLSKLYRNANSVFEYGLGESTYIANEVGVARYAGIDSDVAWVDRTRRSVSKHFRFYYGDVGDTVAWGYPTDPDLAKSVWQYQVAPLQAEMEAFDVYMVDGRFRIPCVFLSFLHASSRGANPKDTIVLIHDCYKKGLSDEKHKALRASRHYHVLDETLELVDHSHQLLCVYKRKESTTDDMLLDFYRRYQDDWS
jgi:hypothetical protein